MKDISRRDFLKYVGAGAAGILAARAKALGISGDDPARDASRVIECYHENATQGSTINQPVVQSMMDESVKALTGIPDVGEAWKSLFPGITQSSTVSIKVNCINRYLSTHPEFVACIVDGLARMQVGGTSFKRNNVIVWDRTNSELTNAGYTIYAGSDPDTSRCFGTDQSGIGYDSSNPLNCNGRTENPSKILSQMSDYVINAGCLKDHSMAGMTFTLKNHIGSVHNAGGMHGNGDCDPEVPACSAQIRDVLTPADKQKLFLVDGLFGIYTGGPGGQPQFNPKLLVMSQDTVACDYHSQSLVNAERVNRGRSAKYASHITTASQSPYNLGTTDIELIQLQNVGIGSPGRVRVDNGLSASPDPFRASTLVTFSLRQAGRVELDLVNAAGRRAASVTRGRLDAGTHRVRLNTPNRLAPGAYFLRLKAEGATRQRRVTVLR